MNRPTSWRVVMALYLLGAITGLVLGIILMRPVPHMTQDERAEVETDAWMDELEKELNR